MLTHYRTSSHWDGAPGLALVACGRVDFATVGAMAVNDAGDSDSVTGCNVDATTLRVSGFPASITSGSPGTFMVTARDACGNTATGYTGTVVDRHVDRVAHRVGLVGPKVSADEAHDLFLGMLEPDQMYEAHVNLIQHGRKICHAQRPECGRCPIRARCRYVDPKAP